MPWFMDNIQWLCFNNLGYRAAGGFDQHGPTGSGYLWLDNPSPLVWLQLPYAGTVRGCHERIEGFVVGC